MVALGVLAGCSSDDAPAGDPEQDQTQSSADPAVVADSTLTDPAEYATDATVVEEPGFVTSDANTATAAELIATFQTNGVVVDDPAAWAAQVIDHRPYQVGDPSGRQFDDLRVALADAGLDAFTAEAIIASLTV
jgi:hypothetical protein